MDTLPEEEQEEIKRRVAKVLEDAIKEQIVIARWKDEIQDNDKE